MCIVSAINEGQQQQLTNINDIIMTIKSTHYEYTMLFIDTQQNNFTPHIASVDCTSAQCMQDRYCLIIATDPPQYVCHPPVYTYNKKEVAHIPKIVIHSNCYHAELIECDCTPNRNSLNSSYSSTSKRRRLLSELTIL